MTDETGTQTSEGMSRRRMLQLLGATSGAAALSAMGANQASAIEDPFPFKPRGRLTRRLPWRQ